MKTATLALACALVLATGCKKSEQVAGSPGDPAAPAAAAGGTALGPLGDFEGEIGVLAKSSKDKLPAAPITVLIKTGRIRFDIPKMEGRPPMHGYMVMNSKDKKAIIVDDDKKTAMVFEASKIQSQLGQMGVPTTPQGAAAGQSPPKITKTGHTDTVAGYQCEDYDITSNDGKRARVCVSETAASWLDVVTHAIPSNLLWAKDFMNGNKFPLRVIAFDTDGTTERDRIEVTKLEKKPLADTMFEVPPGYKVMDLDQMMNGILSGGMAPGMIPGRPMPGQPAMPGQIPTAAPNMTAQMPAGMPTNVAPGQMPAMPPGMPAMSPAQRAQMEDAMKKAQEMMKQHQGAQP